MSMCIGRGSKRFGSARQASAVRVLKPIRFFRSRLPAHPRASCLEPDTRIDRFVMRVELGRGSHGAVWLARDTVRSEDVAVKVVGVGAGRSGTTGSQLNHELSAYAKITDFAHVLRVHEIFTAPWGAVELLLLSMEYADGGSWRKWLKSRNGDWQARRSQGRLYFKQACLGVQAIHTVGEVHRDIKPDNLLLVNDVLKVADFGGSGPAHVVCDGRMPKLFRKQRGRWDSSLHEPGTVQRCPS